MRILFLSTWFPYPADNGSKLRVYHLLRALGAQHEVTLLSFAFATANATAANDLRSFCRAVHVVERDPFARSQARQLLRFFSPTPVVETPLPEMTQATQALLTANRFDAVVASTGVTAPYALLAAKGTSRILEEHNSMARWMHERYRAQTSAMQVARCWVSWQKTLLHETRLFRRFDLVTMVSEQDRAASRAMLPGYRGPLEVVSNGVDCKHNRPGLTSPAPNHLVFNGALTYGANYDAMRWFLAEVYPLIQAKVPDVTVTITGDTTGVNMAGLALDPSVHFSGWVDDVRPVVASAAVCIAPLRTGGGTRLKLLEAMALGTPAVSTSKGAEGLAARDGEQLLLADSAQGFAAAVMQLLADDTLRQRLITNGRTLVETCYDWERIGNRFVQLVEATASLRKRQES